MSEILGQDRLRSALSQHWETWVTEDDFDTMHEYGINHVRVPVPFWAFISTTGDEPYLNDQAAYQAQIERVLGYAYNRGMYALLDFHGLPGSQVSFAFPSMVLLFAFLDRAEASLVRNRS